jgi:hypothetical protein
LTTHVNGIAKNGELPKDEQSPNDVGSEPQQPVSPARTISRKAVPPINSPSIPLFTDTDAKDIQRLMTNASTADECRLIFDMFMARNGAAKASTTQTGVPYPSPLPSPSLTKHTPAPLLLSSAGETLVETTLVEFFLGGTNMPDAVSRVLSKDNQPEVPIEVVSVTTEIQVDDKPAANSLSPSNRPPLSISQQPPSTS